MAKGPTELYHRQLHPYYMTGSLTCLRPEVITERANAEFPLVLNIEPTNACNLKCTFCARNQAAAKTGIHYLDLKLYSMIIDECAGRDIIMINFHKDGEPLLHPHLPAIVELAKKKTTATLHMNTNGLLLAERGMDLLNAGIDDVTVSIDALNPETYLRLKGVDKLKEVQESVLEFIALRDRHKFKTAVRVKIMEMDGISQDEVANFVWVWSRMGVPVQVTGVHNWSGAVDVAVTDETKPVRHACPLLWYALAVNADGKVSICNVDFDRSGVVGNANTQLLAEIWRGDALRHIRGLHLMGIFWPPQVCAGCTVWAGAEPMDGVLRGKEEML